MSIVVKNITKVYGEQKALNNVSFEVKKSEIVGLLGPNGAGKSTMMKILTCFIPPTIGEAQVNGFDVLNQSVEVRRCVGYLPENNPLYLDMYISEYLEFSGGVYGYKGNLQARIKEILHLTGLEPERRKKIGALSKGYRQRVGLAQALLHDPEILILDEPTSGLDPNQIVEIRNLIKEIGKEKTILLSTHIMQEVEAICSKILIINEGEIVADNNTQNISEMFVGNEYVVVEFDSSVDVKLLSKIQGVNQVSDMGNNVYKLQTNQGFDARGVIFKWTVDHNYTILSLQKEKHRLEEVFQKLTKKTD